MTLLHMIRALLLSTPLALGMACKGSEPTAQAPTASAPDGEQPAASKGDTTTGQAAAEPTGKATDGAGDGTTAGSPPPAGQGKGDGTPPAARADIERFQSLFMPIWNTKAGDEQVARACAVADELAASAKAIDKRSPPAGADAEAWLSAIERLHDYVLEVAVYCEDGEDVDTDGVVDLLANAHEWLQTANEMRRR